MKSLYLIAICWICLWPNDKQTTPSNPDLNVLIGTWKLDLSPENKNDSNYALMKITAINGNSFQGEFYREGVKIRNAQLNTQLGIIYGALISGDYSGDYNTAFYYQDGVLHGSTHSINKNFLSVWTATKEK